MFEHEVAELQQAAAEVAGLDTATGTAAEHARLLTSLQQVQDLLGGLTCRVLGEFDTCGGARELGAATTATWCRRELRMSPDEARARVAAGREAMHASQGWLVDVSQTCDPLELGRTITTLAEAVHPERLKDRWEKGDGQTRPAPSGHHGWLAPDRVLGPAGRCPVRHLAASRRRTGECCR